MWSDEMYRIYGLKPALSIDLSKAIEPILLDDRDKVAHAIKQAVLLRRVRYRVQDYTSRRGSPSFTFPNRANSLRRGANGSSWTYP